MLTAAEIAREELSAAPVASLVCLHVADCSRARVRGLRRHCGKDWHVVPPLWVLENRSSLIQEMYGPNRFCGQQGMRAQPLLRAAVAPGCAVQLAPLLVRTSASAGMLAHGIRI